MSFEFEDIKGRKILDYYDNSEFLKLKGDEKRLVKISRKNIERIEEILSIDSSYAYGESKNLIEELHQNKELYSLKYIETICKNLNKENSTHINSDTEGFKRIPKKIMKYKSYDELIEALKSEDYKIIEDIYKKSKEGNYNISFASKFCHYMSIYNTNFSQEERDRFPIYDRIMAKAIPLYLNYYKEKYKELSNIEKEYENIIVVFKKKITRIDLRKREGKRRI